MSRHWCLAHRVVIWIVLQQDRRPCSGTRMPGPADASVWTERHEDLKQAFAERRENKIAEGEGKHASKACAEAREHADDIHEEVFHCASTTPPWRDGQACCPRPRPTLCPTLCPTLRKATCYIGAKGICLVSVGQMNSP